MMNVGDLEFETVSTEEQKNSLGPAGAGAAVDLGLISCCSLDHARAEDDED